jgi:23S rRNA (uracil1939-C5)-methyltransferase
LIDGACEVNEIISVDNPYRYRNKSHYTFAKNKKNLVISGMHAKNPHEVIDIDTCLIQNEKSDEIARSIKSMMKSFKMEPYDEDSKIGF